MTILLKNETGRKRGNYVRYEYGEDLFGYLYLDIIRSKKHCAWPVKSCLFEDKRDLILALDIDLGRRETLDYLPTSIK